MFAETLPTHVVTARKASTARAKDSSYRSAFFRFLQLDVFNNEAFHNLINQNIAGRRLQVVLGNRPTHGFHRVISSLANTTSSSTATIASRR